MKIKSNFLVVSNYNNDLSWVKNYTDNFLIYDRSELPIDARNFEGKVVRQENIGYNLYDYFTFIIDNYEKLPNCIIFVKGNIFPRHVSKSYFENVFNNDIFTKLEDESMLDTSWPISFYSSAKGYSEINNSWYIKHFDTKYFNTYDGFIKFCLKNPKIPTYIPFAPGGNYIVPKENILRFPKVFYSNIRLIISHSMLPGEAHLVERLLNTLWASPVTINDMMNVEIGEAELSSNKYKNYKSPSYIFRYLLGKIGIIYSYMKNKILSPRIIKTHIKNLINSIQKPFEMIREKVEKKNWHNINQINDYRKKIKIYDIFTYNGEADILEIRLNTLNNVVDKFIIVEAPTTFSGLKKPLYFELQKERFAPFLHKIKYYVIDDYPNDKEICEMIENNSSISKTGPLHWKREFYQKESIKKALTHLSMDDICYIGDVDEIWNPDTVIDYSRNNIYKLRQIVYSYFLNNRSSEPWAGTIVTKYKNIKDKCLNDIRTKSKTNYVYISNGGWHLTSMGGLEEVRRKLNDSYTQESYNTLEVQKNLEDRFGESDYIGRNFKFKIDEESLPKYIRDNKIKYRKLFKS